MKRRFAVGAELAREGGASFRVWAPSRKAIDVAFEGEHARIVPMKREDAEYFSVHVPDARADARYKLRLDGRDAFPDPASRSQPEGPHAASAIVDPHRFEWSDAAWRGAELAGQIIYEMHVGTFTRAGTWSAAAEELPELARAGITLIEMMPVAEFAGAFGWGYDGVNPWAPYHHYGTPDDLRRFVDRAHAAGIAVILDVVYNHLGPDGNYLAQFTSDYFSKKHVTDWGEAINFDGERSQGVRDYFADNAAYWISEFHFDGLRFDATQDIHDDTNDHVLAVMARRARAAAPSKSIVLVAENEPQRAKIVRAPRAKDEVGDDADGEEGYGFDALWNDDMHHSAFVALTGRAEAYYTDYRGSPQELVSAAKWGYLYQGQYYSWQKARRGAPALDVPARSFVTFLENHDQVANSATGERVRLQTSPASWRAMTAYLLLGPGTPMLFQGQEFGASTPFLFFADHEPELAKLVRKGRGEFLKQFPSAALPEVQARLAPPALRETFERCKLDMRERDTHAAIYAMHKELIALRKRDRVFASARARVDGAVLGERAFLLRWLGGNDGDRLLVVNMGADLSLTTAPEPLLAAPRDAIWSLVWSSEDPRWGGVGARPLQSEAGEWRLPAQSATVLASRPVAKGSPESSEPSASEKKHG